MANQTSRTYTLNTGAKMPAIGLGTWQSKPSEVQAAVETALRLGYRHIDTAAAYKNEEQVGAGMRASGVPRGDIWLTTKLDNGDHRRAAAALDESLARLGTDYVDLYLMHWPAATEPSDGGGSRLVAGWSFVDTWRAMQALAAAGKARNIGVSNFGTANLATLLAHRAGGSDGDDGGGGGAVPAVNQIELHPGHASPRLVAYNAAHGIHTTGYSCLGSAGSPLAAHPTLLRVARAAARSPQQVLLMWALQKGCSVLPKSVTPARIEANFALDGWTLTDAEMRALDAIELRFKVCGDDWLPVRVFFGDDE